MASLDEINEYMESGNYKSAIEALGKIISEDPNNAKAFYMRGKATFIEAQKNNNEKISGYDAKRALVYSTIEYDLNKAINIDPTILDAYRGLMYLNRDLGNIEKEREYAQILFEKDSISFDALLLLARSYLNNGASDGDFHQAIGFYTDFIEYVDSEEVKIAKFERGLCYYNLNIIERADEEANNLIQEYPFYDDAYYLKGLVLSKYDIQSEEYGEALFFFDKAIEITPGYFGAIYERAKWYYNKGEYKKSIEDYNYILSSNKNRIDVILGKAQALHDFITENENEDYPDSQEGARDLQEAMQLLNYIIDELKIKSNQFSYYRADLRAYQGEFKKAIEELRNVIKGMDEIWPWLYEKMAGWCYRAAEEEEDYRETLSYLEKIKEEDYTSSTYYITAYSSYEIDDFETAVIACKKFFSMEASGEWTYGHWIYAVSLDMTGSKDYELIIEHLRKCLIEKDEGFVYSEIGRIMLYNAPHKYMKDGMEMIEKAVELDNPFSMYLLSQEFFYGNDIIKPDPNKAIELAKRAFKEDETIECSLTLIGKAYEIGAGMERNEKKAFEYYEKAYNVGEDNDTFCSCAKGALAHSYFIGLGVKKDKKKALKIVKEVMDKNGRDSHNNIILLYSYFALKGFDNFDLNKSLELLETAMPYPTNIFFPMMLKRIYKRLKKYDLIERATKIQEETLKRSGELYKIYAKKYLNNFNDFYPMIYFIKK